MAGDTENKQQGGHYGQGQGDQGQSGQYGQGQKPGQTGQTGQTGQAQKGNVDPNKKNPSQDDQTEDRDQQRRAS
jgi:hypothetical protein